MKQHDCQNGICPDFASHEMARKRGKAQRRRKERDQMMRDLGLTKALGAVSGKTYWE